MNLKVFVTKADAERLWPLGRSNEGETNINTNLNLGNFDRRDENKGSLDYNVTISYDPGIARVGISGECRIEGEKSEMDEIESGEKGDVMGAVTQSIMNTALVKAVKLTDMVNVSPPVPLPSVGSGGDDSKKVENVGPEFR